MPSSSKKALIAPSLLSADFLRLGDEVRAVEAAGADLLHVDVMDGVFVPNLTLGPPIVKAIHRAASRPLDVHLMIEAPERWVQAYVDAGAAWLTVHVETSPHLHRTLQTIAAAGAEAGVVLNPHTPESAIEYVLELCHHVLVMSVNPGFGGQRFIPEVLPKVERLAALIQKKGLATVIEIDGGIAPDTIASAWNAGAEVFVAGNAVFAQPSYADAITALRDKTIGA